MKNMHQSEIVLYMLVLFHVGMGVLLFAVNPEYFREYYVIEDGILEWLGFDALLFTGILSFYRLRLWRKRPLTFSVGVLLTGLFFTFGAGEDISYGQRLFKIPTPAFFQQYNKQGELNIHNLRFKSADPHKKEFSVNKVVFGLGLGFIYFISGISASLLSVGMNGNIISVGASGAIFGLFGALVYFGYSYRGYIGTIIRSQIVPIVLYNLLMGFFIPGIDMWGHIGGLIGGIITAKTLGTIENKKYNPSDIILFIIYFTFLIYLGIFR